MSEDRDGDFELLLEYLRDNRGFDFTGYKRASLRRRIGKRMDELGIEHANEYLDYLEVHPDEFAQLFDTILINVTAFFRDPPAWQYLAEQALPPIVEAKPERAQIRVWTAGCASGEEAYTAAIVLAEALGPDAFAKRVKVYATDADEDALTTARHGVYSAKEVDGVPDALVSKYFEQVGSRFAFRKDLRRSVIFGRHDLVQDAPISRLDLLICRNTLMYFNAQLQARVLRNFHFALNDPGFLFLGKAETLLTHNELFAPLDLRHRVFTKVARSAFRDGFGGFGPRDAGSGTVARHVLLRDAAIDSAPVAQILVDLHGELVMANDQAKNMFAMGRADLGKQFQDLEISYRPVELRSRIETAYNERRPVIVANVDRGYNDGEIQTFDVTIAPVFDTDESPLGVVISFADVTRYRKLRSELERSNQELETAYEELQSTNEELETTNEELQSTVEELETTNEELQSANEELETTNEELQSTNAEVQAMNEEMRERSLDLNRMIAFSQSVLSTLHLGVIVVDRDGQIRSWNDRSEDMWGVRADEVDGAELSRLDIGLPVAELTESITRCMNGQAAGITVDATNRRGRAIRCQVRCNPLVDPDGTIQGAVILIEET
jgi:two-component system CheB/CheR fusion protein